MVAIQVPAPGELLDPLLRPHDRRGRLGRSRQRAWIATEATVTSGTGEAGLLGAKNRLGERGKRGKL
jgi:hypothetical protein